MAKNDYFVIAYRILKYLYEAFQTGESPELCMFGADALGINEAYWCNVMESLSIEGYVRGATIIPRLGGNCGLKLNDIKITQKGIEYLQENSMMAKARNMLKGIKETIPGL